MSQNSIVIADSNGVDFLTHLNNSNNTLGSNQSGNSAPASPIAGMTWHDETTEKLWVRNTANTAWKAQLIADFQGSNIQHSIRNSASWVYNQDGAVTGAIQIKITGLYSQTLSGGMEIAITQNSGTDGTYIDYLLYVGGNWRSSDHTWHNTKATIIGSTSPAQLNVRFCYNTTDVFIVIGDVTSTWGYPRVVVKDIISNAIISGYSPDFVISTITTLPTTTASTILATDGTGADIYNAPSKTTPVNADLFGLFDSVTSALNNVSWTNIKATLKTYFDGLYASLTNLKTVNSISLIGTGNISMQGLPQNYQTFTSSGTFTVPAGVYLIMAAIGSAGGAGGGSNIAHYAGNGGGGNGEFYFTELLYANAGQVLTITIGAGGAGSTGDGAIGGTTSIVGTGVSIIIAGCIGGLSSYGLVVAGGGVQAFGKLGTSYGALGAGNGGNGGNGGAGINGLIALGGTTASHNGAPALANTGSGGGGAFGTANAAGGAGGSGKVIIFW